MKQIIRYLLFVGLPFLVVGGFFVMVGIMREKVADIVPWNFDDTLRLLVTGIPAALIGVFIERVTRKTIKEEEPKSG